MITPTVCLRFYWQELPDPIIVALCVLVSLFIALVNWPGTSMSQRVAQVTIILFEVAVEIYAIGHRLKFLRWRREYERSIDRLIRTIHPGCEGGSAIEW
jgi:membrane protein YdbS with pleckstrin-like domain